MFTTKITETQEEEEEEKVHLLEIEHNVDDSALPLKSDNEFKLKKSASDAKAVYIPWYSMKQKFCQNQVPNNLPIIRGKRFLGILSIILLLLYFNSTIIGNDVDEEIPVIHYSHVPGMKGYLVWSDRCKMPNINPYTPDVMKFFTREKYKSCGHKKSLTTTEFNEDTKTYSLILVEKNLKLYGASHKVKCCYQIIYRNITGEKADQEISLDICKDFIKKVQLPSRTDNILVSCREGNKEVYKNGHALIPYRDEIFERQKILQSDNDLRAPSVLMIGIDSISRLNLIRAMPKTAQYLYDNEWFELSGYNKIDDNTFPNLLAVLTGRNPANVHRNCTPTKLGGLDKCNFIWKDFEKAGYVTAYAEDVTTINTFNYNKKGFQKQPVDYYLQPFLIAAENHLYSNKKSGLVNCLGYKHAAEHVYDYALNLAQRYTQKPFFGFFWTNSFSHNAISDCSSMDERMVEYFKEFTKLGTFNNTIVIFFSDHGMRFGPTRKTFSGHYEERLPFIFIWLPAYIKQTHPEFVSALSINKNRLTNPYDLHMTLKHILNLSNNATLTPAMNCARCQSLLNAVPHNRSCEDIEIDDHWCTCNSYQNVFKDSKLIHKLAHDIIAYLNNFVHEFRNGSFANKCATLSLQNIESASRAHNDNFHLNINKSIEVYRLVFYTKPNRGLFEATVRYNTQTQSLNVTGEISRLNIYATDSDCVEDSAAKKYCSCRRHNKNG